jgi:hypothetical protein
MLKCYVYWDVWVVWTISQMEKTTLLFPSIWQWQRFCNLIYIFYNKVSDAMQYSWESVELSFPFEKRSRRVTHPNKLNFISCQNWKKNIYHLTSSQQERTLGQVMLTNCRWETWESFRLFQNGRGGSPQPSWQRGNSSITTWYKVKVKV